MFLLPYTFRFFPPHCDFPTGGSLSFHYPEPPTRNKAPPRNPSTYSPPYTSYNYSPPPHSFFHFQRILNGELSGHVCPPLLPKSAFTGTWPPPPRLRAWLIPFRVDCSVSSSLSPRFFFGQDTSYTSRLKAFLIPRFPLQPICGSFSTGFSDSQR